MIATSHVIIGGAVGVAVGAVSNNPALALAAGIASHLICDSIPHLDAPFQIEYEDAQHNHTKWTKKLFIFALADSITAFLLTLFLWQKYFELSIISPFAWGAFGAYLPDFLDNVPFWNKTIRDLPGFKKFHKIHLGTHNLWRFKYVMPDYWFLGTITQIAFVIPSLWFISR